MTIRRTGAVALAVAGLTAAAACSGAAPKPQATHPSSPAASSPAGAATFPATPVGTQARWLFAAAAHAPIPAAQVTAHFDQAFLAQVPPARLNAVLADVTSLRLDAIPVSTPDALVMIVTADGQTELNVSLTVDSRGLISGLVFRPATSAPAALPAPPATWAGVDRQARSAAPQVRLLVAAVDGTTCRPVNAIDATTAAPLGSAFKLYVLDALARAVAAGKVRWNQQLTVTSQVKSLPSGELQNDPDGTRVTVRQAAADMISVSDNTAADMVITLLGRTSVEAAAAQTGMADPGRDVPFLTTRELFTLKLDDWPRLADQYLASSAAGRQAMLTELDRVPYGTLASLSSATWTAPRDINSLEWFASPADICRVYA